MDDKNLFKKIDTNNNQEEKKNDISSRYIIDPTTKTTQVSDRYFNTVEPRVFDDYEDLKDIEDDNELPLPLQKFYHILNCMETENEKTKKSKKKNNNVEVPENDNNNNKKEMKELERCLRRVDFTAQDLNAVFKRIQKYTRTWIPEHIVDMSENMFANLDIMTRGQDDFWLRTKGPDDRDCVSDDDCQGRYLMPNKSGHTLTECLTEEDQETFIKTGKLPELRRSCLACQRYFAAYYYINLRAECDNMRTDAKLAKFCNIVDQAGEYILDQCIITSGTKYQGLPAPVVLHCRRYYEQKIDNEKNIVYYIQKGYYKSEQITNSMKNLTLSTNVKNMNIGQNFQ